ncbi:MAG: DNA polymerase III subunit delta [Deltaproteobacteria bacterium]|nr:DNA polymerase III subunit delta [Deltaproteobacteria bacterium]MCB9786210.1 DNA polymerase III subunit delta [Deltaproteobacteria bacterium]
MADPIADLARELSAHGPKPLYLVQGPERLWVDAAVREILRAAVGDPDDTMAITRVDLAESGRGAKDVLGACRSLGLFAQKQAVLVRGADVLDKRTTDRDALADYAQAPDPQTTLILVASKLTGTTSLVRRIKKSGAVLSFEPLKPWQTPPWIAGEARRLGHPIDDATARLIGDLTGTGLLELRMVVEQLSLYVGPGQPVTSAAVEALLVSTRAHTVFELADAVGERRLVPALEHLHAMLSQREPALRILAMLIRHFRLLWQVREARDEGLDLASVQRQLSIHEFVAKKLWAQTAQFRPTTLRRIYDTLYATDLRLKSSGLEDDLVMERLVMDLCG